MTEVIKLETLLSQQQEKLKQEQQVEMDKIISSFNTSASYAASIGRNYVYMTFARSYHSESLRKEYFKKVSEAGYFVKGTDEFAKAYFNRPFNLISWLGDLLRGNKSC